MIIHFTASAGVHLKILLTSYTAWCTLKQDLQSGHSVHAASPRAHKCHCSRVTTSTAWPSNVTVLSMRVATGAMATWTGRLPWARLVTTVWYMLTGIWTKPAEWFDTYYAFKFHLSTCFEPWNVKNVGTIVREPAPTDTLMVILSPGYLIPVVLAESVWST